MSKKKQFSSFQNQGNAYMPLPNYPIDQKLPAGVYTFNVDPDTGISFFTAMETQSDAIIDLPSPEYDRTMKVVHQFLRTDPSTRAKFQEKGFLYKRGIIFHGAPGAGKTILVTKISQEVIKLGGIVLFNPNPGNLKVAVDILKDVQPDQLIMVIFEELDQLVHDFEDELLNILDGELQVDNIIFAATTNFFEEVPKRLLRPSRLGTHVKVGFPNAEARRVYLQNKLTEKEQVDLDINNWVKKTEGFSIDELKETVVSVCCLEVQLDTVVDIITTCKEEIQSNSDSGIAAASKRAAAKEFRDVKNSWFRG